MQRAQKNSAERRKPVLFLLAGLGLVLLYGILNGRHGASRYIQLRHDLETRSREAYERIARNRTMLEQLQGLRTDDKALEKAARTTLGVVNEDEIVVVFREPQDTRRH